MEVLSVAPLPRSSFVPPKIHEKRVKIQFHRHIRIALIDFLIMLSSSSNPTLFKCSMIQQGLSRVVAEDCLLNM